MTKTEEAVKKGARKTKEAATPASGVTKAKQHEKTAANDEAGATGKCHDGTYAHAKHKQGACARHGGVAEWLKQ